MSAYVQCKLSREGWIHVAWIERKPGLHVGSSVKLKDTDNEFWLVEDIYDNFTMSEENLKRKQSFDKKQREGFDI